MFRKLIVYSLSGLVIIVAVLLVNGPQLAIKQTSCKDIKIHNEIQIHTSRL